MHHSVLSGGAKHRARRSTKRSTEVFLGVRTEIDDGLGWLILDRPERAHAYDRAHLDALAEGIETFREKVAVVVVASTGEGAFCAGADLTEIAERTVEDVVDLRSQRTFETLASAPFVSIAAVQGPAVGGGFELALACDFRVVGPRASFRFPEIEFGLLPAAGGLTRLSQMLGAARTKEITWLADPIDAAGAVALGLATRKVADARTAAADLGRELLKRDPLALRLSKALLDGGATLVGERAAQAILTEQKR
jgi:enoyl-CoA hydratase/carnithine racemase